MLLLYLFLLNLVAAVRRDLRSVPAAPAEPVNGASAGGATDRLIVLEAPGLEPGTSISLRDPFVLGRAAECDLPLADRLVSGRHARIRRQDGRWVLEDLKSTNGTQVNREAVQGQRVLESGDVIQLGAVRLKLAR